MQIIIDDLSAKTGNLVTFDGIGGSNGVYVVSLVYKIVAKKMGYLPILYTAGKVVLLVGFI